MNREFSYYAVIKRVPSPEITAIYKIRRGGWSQESQVVENFFSTFAQTYAILSECSTITELMAAVNYWGTYLALREISESLYSKLSLLLAL